MKSGLNHAAVMVLTACSAIDSGAFKAGYPFDRQKNTCCLCHQSTAGKKGLARHNMAVKTA